MPVQKCAICSRPSIKTREHDCYCLYHSQAYDGLVYHYKSWTTAYGKVSWHEYLNKMITQEETGQWIKEIASAELRKIKEKG